MIYLEKSFGVGEGGARRHGVEERIQEEHCDNGRGHIGQSIDTKWGTPKIMIGIPQEVEI